MQRFAGKVNKKARVLDTWRERRCLLVVSPAIVAEIRATLSYPRIRRKYARLF